MRKVQFKRYSSTFFAILLLTILSVGCSKTDTFTSPAVESSYTTEQRQTVTQSDCAQYTLVKPQVDILILWDNSGSSLLIDTDTKNALNSTISGVSEDFNYRMIVAPITAPSSGDEVQYFTNDNTDLSSSVDISSIDNLTTFTSVTGGSIEKGFERAYNLMSSNISTFFRKKAYHIVMVISNEDDDYYSSTDDTRYWVSSKASTDYSSWKTKLLALRTTYETSMFRFISVQPHSTVGSCKLSSHNPLRYRTMSKDIFAEIDDNYNGTVNDQDGRTYPDAYDLCTTERSEIFDGINSTIQAIVQSHVYEYWLVDESSSSSVTWDTSSITVKDSYGSTIPNSSSNGFTYIGYKSNQYTRSGYVNEDTQEYTSDPGEYETGHFIQLKGDYAPTGSKKIKYPNCLYVSTTTPIDTYGYVYISEEPDSSSIELYINGTSISQSTSNGWSYLGYKENLNMKVSGSPAMYRTGYFLQLYGDAQYSNGDVVSVRYLRASK